MDRRYSAACVAALALTAGACAQTAPEAFPQARADAWAERFDAHDAAGLAALYTEDAVLLPPDQEIVSGRAAIQDFYARTNAPGSPPVELATIETLVFGDHAWRQGGFRIEGPGDAPTDGKFVELWKKVDGDWLIHRDIWNANAPRPASSEAGAAPADATPRDAANDEPA